MKNHSRKQRGWHDAILKLLIFASTGVTVGVLAIILGFILYKGLPEISIGFLTKQWDDKTTFVDIVKDTSNRINTDETYISSLGIYLEEINGAWVIASIDENSVVEDALNMKKELYALKQDDIITRIDDIKVNDLTLDEIIGLLEKNTDVVRLKITRPGGGIVPMFVSTIYMIFLSLMIAAPIGISSAIYLNEYARSGKILRILRFAIQNLAGIPSIIYGLFGMLIFVQMCNMQYSILAGALTLSIMLLPTMISTTEEALKEIPKSYRDSSYGLGATKLQTIGKIILPEAIPGILVAVILSIGRIVGESAALIFTAGTVAQIPSTLVGSEAGAATLTTKMYWLIKETAALEEASSIAVVLLLLIIFLNLISKVVTKSLLKKRGV